MKASFPLEAPVVLQGLVKAPDLNGKSGIIRSTVSNGRQQVFVPRENKSVALKICNIRYEGRSVQSLSAKELKTVLSDASNSSSTDSELTGIDKSELRSKVSNLNLNEEKISEILAIANAPSKSTAAAATTSPYSTVNPAQAANALSNMSPDQLLQQARAMKSMDPSTLRRMNPQFANLTNEQILMTANQMEMMANNPHMMKAAADQVKNMQPGDMEKMQEEMANGNINANTGMAASSQPQPPTPNQIHIDQAKDVMANMTPEQLKQQANMMKSMDPNAVRQMNPQLAHMSDEQIKTATSQIEMMADNPDMMKMAMDSMKNMSPEQAEAMKNGTMPSSSTMGQQPMMGGLGGGPDLSKMLDTMDTKQLKQMLQQVKTNPDMMKQFAQMSGLSEEQMSQGIDQFANMEDANLDRAVQGLKKAQKVKNIYTNVNAKVGGHLMKIIIGVVVIIVVLIVKRFFWFSNSSSSEINVPLVDPLNYEEIPNVASVDEFASEF